MPVIILSGRSRESDRVRGLRAGADDYVVKPFSRDELIARVAAVLRRAIPCESIDVIELHGLRLDAARIRVTANGVPLDLGPLEFRLLRHLMMHPSRVHTRDELIDHVWRKKEPVDPRAVDDQIRRLRKLLAGAGCADCIQTVYGIGYRFGPKSAI